MPVQVAHVRLSRDRATGTGAGDAGERPPRRTGRHRQGSRASVDEPSGADAARGVRRPARLRARRGSPRAPKRAHRRARSGVRAAGPRDRRDDPTPAPAWSGRRAELLGVVVCGMSPRASRVGGGVAAIPGTRRGIPRRGLRGHARGARAYVAELGVDWPSVLDPRSSTALDYGVNGVPETFVIGRDGRILAKRVGAVDYEWLATLVGSAVRRDVP